MDGVWIGCFLSTLGIAVALRENIIQINSIKLSEVGKNQKIESLYNYLTSHEFSQRIEAILEAFGTMKIKLMMKEKPLKNNGQLEINCYRK